jgi:splicing factor 3A subunit 2
VAKDPYILRNHLGGVECRLCLTIHTGEDSYLSHTQGKKHQTNLARWARFHSHAGSANVRCRRAAKEAKDSTSYMATILAQQQAERAVPVKQFIKIGTPGYNIHKLREPESGAYGLRVRFSPSC